MNDLLSIKTIIRARVGSIDDAVLSREINYAWEEMWQTQDLTGSLWQVYLRPFSVTDKFVTCPADVLHVRAIKNAPLGFDLKQRQPSAFYGDPKTFQNITEVRLQGNSPLSTNLTSVTPLTFSIPIAAPSDISVSVVGQTAQGDRDRETITIVKGARAATSLKAFGPRIDSISRAAYSPINISITDQSARVVSSISAAFPTARFVSLQLVDMLLYGPNSAQWAGAYDVLYKRRAAVLNFDEDVVPSPHNLALINQTVSNILSLKTGDEKRANTFAAKASALNAVTQLNENEGAQQIIKLAQNPFNTYYSGTI